MQKKLLAVLAALSFTCCVNAVEKTEWTIKGTVSGVDNQIAFVLAGQKDTLAQSVVKNGAFVLKGTSDAMPRFAIVAVDNHHAAQTFLEAGTINANLDKREATGTPLNDALNDFTRFNDKVMIAYNTPGANQDSLQRAYNDNLRNVASQHVGDVFGLMLTWQLAREASVAQIDSLMAQSPVYQKDENLQQMRVAQMSVEATSAGHPFIDVAGTNATTGAPMKLSDIAGKGKPTIVDFWASWCGPCRREINQSLSKYAQQYKDQCNFVGIAVWENSINDTKTAMSQLPISWPILFAGDSNDSPTDKYGIQGIPEIMLIGADGSILARGLRGEAIAQAIEKALGK